jgi:serine/threonine protein kinase
MNLVHECVQIIHRDIKPENLLIDENDRIKITDFGLSLFTKNGNDEVRNTAGSTLFFAPEVIDGKTYSGKKSDVWALGVTLYYMVFRKYPFYAINRDQLYPKIKTEE